MEQGAPVDCSADTGTLPHAKPSKSMLGHPGEVWKIHKRIPPPRIRPHYGKGRKCWTARLTCQTHTVSRVYESCRTPRNSRFRCEFRLVAAEDMAVFVERLMEHRFPLEKICLERKVRF
jgi:hypothetical protein